MNHAEGSPIQSDKKDIVVHDVYERTPSQRKSKRFWFILGAALIAIVVALGIGLGVSSHQRGIDSLQPLSDTGNFWRPAAGTRWQIVLNGTLDDQTSDVPVYDIDLFLNTAATVAKLHAAQRKVICYFSAGSYEPNRPDSRRFRASDKGRPLDGWPDENWLNIKSHNVRKIMRARLDRAAQIGCDGVDPDNIDGYDNANGFGLRATDAVDFVHFLATEAHRRNLAIGLKNAGALVPTVIGLMQWAVNEQCVEFAECEKFRSFVDAGKPVFHIEYSTAVSGVSAASSKFCGDDKARGFSTVVKDLLLDNWVMYC